MRTVYRVREECRLHNAKGTKVLRCKYLPAKDKEDAIIRSKKFIADIQSDLRSDGIGIFEFPEEITDEALITGIEYAKRTNDDGTIDSLFLKVEELKRIF